MTTTATTTHIRFSEPTVRAEAAQAYSQCIPEPNFGYAQQQVDYGYYHQQASMPVPPMAFQAPVAKSSSAGKGLLLVAGLAVVGAAAFGGVMLLNSTDAKPAPTASSTAPVADPTGSVVVNSPSEITIPSLAPAQNAQTPVIVNNPAPLHVSSPSIVSKPAFTPAPKTVNGSAQAPVQAFAPAPAQIAAPAPAPAPGQGVNVKAPFVEVGVPGQGQPGDFSVKTPGVEVGQGPGGFVLDVLGGQSSQDSKKDATTTDDKKDAADDAK
jgi:hypothetical protein